MQFTQSLFKVPHAIPTRSRQVFFGQLLVSTTHDQISFAKEVANAIIIQAKLNEVHVDYTPRGSSFITCTKGYEHVLEFEGDLAAYLKVPINDARFFHVSFREAGLNDRSSARDNLNLLPDYVLTLSMVASQAGEMGDPGFWRQLAYDNLSTGIGTPGPDGRTADPNVKIAVIYGNQYWYEVILK